MTARPDTITALRDSPKIRFLQTIIPQVPNLFYKSLLHSLNLNPPSRNWDLRTLLTIEFLRYYLTCPSRGLETVERAQELTSQQRKVTDETWKVDVTIPVEEKGLEEAVRGVVDKLGSAGSGEELEWVGTKALTGEWIGNRAVRGRRDGWEAWGEDKKYKKMMEEVADGEEGMVILLLHGGAYFICDPVTHRPLAQKIASAYSGRVFLPRYRLAPQNPFPAASLDTLLSYLYLLHPPPGSFHAPIPPQRIIFAGDSAGGGLVLSTIQLLLDLRDAKIHWFGKEVTLPLPAGVAALSPWLDVARCLEGLPEEKVPGGGSEEGCKEYDYLPTPRQERRLNNKPSAAWDGGVKRSKFYAPNTLITHPLVSPITAKSWTGAPPIWISVGDECLRDSIFLTTHAILRSHTPLRLEYTSYLPHVFPAILSYHPASKVAYDSLARFIKSLHPKSTQKVETGNVRIHPVTLKVEVMEDKELQMGLEEGEIVQIMDRVVKGWERMPAGARERRGIWWIWALIAMFWMVVWK